MLEDIMYVGLWILFIVFGGMIGIIVLALVAYGLFFMWDMCKDFISLFKPKNYRKGGKFHQK